jgi:hypothetical protein
MYTFPRGAVRVAYGIGAFVLGDLVTGLAAFSIISAGALWMFSMGWIHLQSEYSAAGLNFGTAFQLDLAWFGAIVSLPLLLFVGYLGYSALQWPLGMFHRARRG